MKYDNSVKWEQLYQPLFGYFYSSNQGKNIYVQCRLWRIVDNELQYKTVNGITYAALDLHFPRKEDQ